MILARYARWLHTGWPAGTVERSPEVHSDGTTSIPGVRVVGDLTGVPLLKLAADSGARAIEAIRNERFDGTIAILGAGVAGIAAALAAKQAGLAFVLFDAKGPWSTIHDFPSRKPIFTYPTDLTPAGPLAIHGDVKEALLEELERQRVEAGVQVERANVDRIERSGDALRVVFTDREPTVVARVLIAIGRGGNYRALGCAGEDLDKVHHRLHDPADHRGKDVLVVGGGDSALESAIALRDAGARVSIAYRGESFSRPKAENIEGVANIRTLFSSTVETIAPGDVTLSTGETIPNDVVFAMIGREAPLDFFRRSRLPIRNEWGSTRVLSLAAFLAACTFVYLWKAGTSLNAYFSQHHLFPFAMPERIGASAFGHALGVSLRQPGFYYSLLYSIVIVVFGARRIARRKTPYVRAQTLTLITVQVVPLFLLPYLVLPTLGYLGAFDHGVAKTIADALFPVANYDYGREYWRAFGLVLAWPLFFWNFMTGAPMTWWLVIGFVQTFVILPIIVVRWGKGAYCGWICSCGGLAETLGDTHRQKMPHGPAWNRVNLLGQAILLWATVLFVAQIVMWTSPSSRIGHAATWLRDHTFYAHAFYDYYHLVDIGLAGIVGVGAYFWFSGRVWCRFACPLAALMHIYARLGRFRIFADKKKCISCNVCTSVCHQGIDVMSFANKGKPMEDPECVRCSACVEGCPTGVLSFGRATKHGPVLDTLPASLVQMKQGRSHLRIVS